MNKKAPINSVKSIKMGDKISLHKNKSNTNKDQNDNNDRNNNNLRADCVSQIRRN